MTRRSTSTINRRLFPTADAHTFLGWLHTCAPLGGAIACCHRRSRRTPLRQPYHDIAPTSSTGPARRSPALARAACTPALSRGTILPQPRSHSRERHASPRRLASPRGRPHRARTAPPAESSPPYGPPTDSARSSGARCFRLERSPGWSRWPRGAWDAMRCIAAWRRVVLRLSLHALHALQRLELVDGLGAGNPRAFEARRPFATRSFRAERPARRPERCRERSGSRRARRRALSPDRRPFTVLLLTGRTSFDDLLPRSTARARIKSCHRGLTSSRSAARPGAGSWPSPSRHPRSSTSSGLPADERLSWRRWRLVAERDPDHEGHNIFRLTSVLEARARLHASAALGLAGGAARLAVAPDAPSDHRYRRVRAPAAQSSNLDSAQITTRHPRSAGSGQSSPGTWGSRPRPHVLDASRSRRAARRSLPPELTTRPTTRSRPCGWPSLRTPVFRAGPDRPLRLSGRLSWRVLPDRRADGASLRRGLAVPSPAVRTSVGAATSRSCTRRRPPGCTSRTSLSLAHARLDRAPLGRAGESDL